MAGITLSCDVNLQDQMPAFIAMCEEAALATVRETTHSLERIAKVNAPFKTGNLRDSIHSEVRGRVGIVRSTAPYTLPQELGASDHAIFPRTKQALYWDELDHPVDWVNHPGNPATHFLRRSVDVILPRFLEAAKRFYPG